jgi:hypothetical protein
MATYATGERDPNLATVMSAYRHLSRELLVRVALGGVRPEPQRHGAGDPVSPQLYHRRELQGLPAQFLTCCQTRSAAGGSLSICFRKSARVQIC